LGQRDRRRVGCLLQMKQQIDSIDRDVPCKGCGYNLRGLSPAGNCPECNEPIDASLQALKERTIPLRPAEMDRLNSGLVLLLAAILAELALFILAIVVSELHRGRIVAHLYMVCSVAAVLVAAVGAKRCARESYTVVATLVLAAIVAARVVLQFTGALPWTTPSMAIAMSIAIAVAAGSVLHSMSPVARMMKETALAKNSRQALIAFLGFSALAGYLSLMGRPTMYSMEGMPFLADVGVLGIALVMLWSYRRKLKKRLPAGPAAWHG
ncbi:MAG: hypothetical protein JXQ75_20360, partial [Phycisphaerae bacterium]|nr:hypothetical protein [Phycisphaerae bacterium]